MTTLVSFLRGINVGGHNMVKMPELADLYRSLDFANVRTYLQSGNVIFSHADKEASGVSDKIEKALKQRLGLDVTVFLRTRDQLRTVVAGNPFIEESPSKLHVGFLRTKPVNLPLDRLKALRDRVEEFAIKNREVYLFLPNGIGRSKLSNNFLEKAFGIPATTRNWNTVTAVTDLAAENPA